MESNKILELTNKVLMELEKNDKKDNETFKQLEVCKGMLEEVHIIREKIVKLDSIREEVSELEKNLLAKLYECYSKIEKALDAIDEKHNK